MKRSIESALPPSQRRRSILKLAAASVAFPAYLRASSGFAAGRKIKVGVVAPKSGPLAPFSEADDYVFESVSKAIAGGVKGSAGTFEIEFIVRDSKSDPKHAAKLARQLLGEDEVDLMLASDTPETSNPVADQCEYYEIPCISTVAPWQAYFFGRRGEIAKGFDWTYHFFWGLEGVMSAYVSLWDDVKVNKVVGGLFPKDIDGRIWSDLDFGLPPELTQRGYRFVDGGRYQPFTKDFSQQISLFQEQGVEIITGVVPPPDFITFWNQSAEMGFKPKVVTVGKALLFPSVVQSMGDRGEGLSTEVWWSPAFPYKSGLTGETAKELAANYTAATKRPWTQPLGFRHALLEVAIDCLKRAADPTDKNALKAAIDATNYDSVAGNIKWGGLPVKNVARTPVVGGQWKKGPDGNLEVVVVENKNAAKIPVSGQLSLLS